MNFSNVNQNATPFSIYIPRVSAEYNAPLLEHIFNRDIGAVERVDLLPCGVKKWADRANPNTRFNKVFVHLKYFYNYGVSKKIQQALSQDGGSYSLPTQPYEYFILLKNRDPVPSTILNIHQVVDNCRLMEQEVETQKQEIAELKTMVADLEAKNDRMIQEFMQVFGRLQHNNELLLKTSVYGMYNFMKRGTDTDEEEEDEDDSKLSLSTHSSMPSLIEEYEDNIPTGKKMTINELSLSSSSSSSSTSSSSGSVSAIPVIERIRNSAELCGNN